MRWTTQSKNDASRIPFKHFKHVSKCRYWHPVSVKPFCINKKRKENSLLAKLQGQRTDICGCLLMNSRKLRTKLQMPQLAGRLWPPKGTFSTFASKVQPWESVLIRNISHHQHNSVLTEFPLRRPSDRIQWILWWLSVHIHNIHILYSHSQYLWAKIQMASSWNMNSLT